MITYLGISNYICLWKEFKDLIIYDFFKDHIILFSSFAIIPQYECNLEEYFPPSISPLT